MTPEQLSTEHARTMEAMSHVRRELCQMRRRELETTFADANFYDNFFRLFRERQDEFAGYNGRLGRIVEHLEEMSR